ncbi:hypothetical protein EHQ53_13950 [Leptospira langatensis]|uniref:Uncharacterized protein n=1 Tax=Leptospira langatensis TaxID=2484983 RepID=A0ABY2MAY4_9LEPT|nr:hypothetical protein [Leptospira langatensis]TGL39620.1 hypothetical protein EHQ53_13950 [Leptospira langatensis]
MIRDPSEFIPRPLVDNGGLWTNFLNVWNDLYSYFFTKIKNMRFLFWAERTDFPIELGITVGAYLSPGDSIDTIRSKTGNAVMTHKNLPIFSRVYKPIIDSITGGDCSIYNGLIYYGSFIVGASIIGSPSMIGYVPFGTGVLQAKQKGAIYINLGLSPTDDQINEILLQLRDIIPIYFRVYFGVTTTIVSDVFEVGTSLIGGVDLIGGPASTATIFSELFRVN